MWSCLLSFRTQKPGIRGCKIFLFLGCLESRVALAEFGTKDGWTDRASYKRGLSKESGFAVYAELEIK